VFFRRHRKPPEPPETAIIRAKFLLVGDSVWCPGFTFRTVTSAEPLDTVFVEVALDHGEPIVFIGGDPVRIALSRSAGQAWNTARARFKEDTVQLLERTYGVPT
jgi:hypothetical protein